MDFKTFRDNMDLWYSGIKSQIGRNGGDGQGKCGGSADGKGSTRVDKRDIAVWKLPEDPGKLSF